MVIPEIVLRGFLFVEAKVVAGGVIAPLYSSLLHTARYEYVALENDPRHEDRKSVVSCLNVVFYHLRYIVTQFYVFGVVLRSSNIILLTRRMALTPKRITLGYITPGN